MTQTVQEILEQIQKLPEEDRLALEEQLAQWGEAKLRGKRTAKSGIHCGAVSFVMSDRSNQLPRTIGRQFGDSARHPHLELVGRQSNPSP